MIGGVAGPAARLAGEPSVAERFGGVKHWEVHVSYSSYSPYQLEDRGTKTSIPTRQAWLSGRIELETKVAGSRHVQAVGKGPVLASHHEEQNVSDKAGLRTTRYDYGSGACGIFVQLDFNPQADTYEFELLTYSMEDTYGGTEGEYKYGPKHGTSRFGVPLPARRTKLLRLPKTSRVISDSFSWEERWAKEDHTPATFLGSPETGTLRWTIIPLDQVDSELVVEPKDYDNWLPQGGADEQTAGNILPVTATVVPKAPGAPTKATRFTFRLTEVSREPGVALNLPVAGAKATPDLSFEAAKHPGCKVEDDGATLTTPEGSAELMVANVSSFDWGAYGTLLVTAELSDGRLIVGHLKGQTAHDVLLPKRVSSSRIADKWKSMMHFTGADDEDAGVQPRNNNPGDGLSAYEKYRGLIAGGRHTRGQSLLDPKRKDLVVANEMGQKRSPGLTLFGQASGIDVVELARGELPESRQVNVNHGYAHLGDQYGLVLKSGDLGGRSVGINLPAERHHKTPRLSDAVIIDMNYAGTLYNAQAAATKAGGVRMLYALADQIDTTIAHEIAHGVGAEHHGPATDFHGRHNLTVNMPDWHAFGDDGVPLLPTADKPIELLGNIGRPGNDASGDAECMMAYVNFYQWAAVGPSGGSYSYYAVGIQPLGRRFCTSPAATGMNAPRKLPNGRQVPGFFGDAISPDRGTPAGNCLGAMRVRDR